MQKFNPYSTFTLYAREVSLCLPGFYLGFFACLLVFCFGGVLVGVYLVFCFVLVFLFSCLVLGFF